VLETAFAASERASRSVLSRRKQKSLKRVEHWQIPICKKRKQAEDDNDEEEEEDNEARMPNRTRARRRREIRRRRL
jgi:hypothetical protein